MPNSESPEAAALTRALEYLPVDEPEWALMPLIGYVDPVGVEFAIDFRLAEAKHRPLDEEQARENMTRQVWKEVIRFARMTQRSHAFHGMTPTTQAYYDAIKYCYDLRRSEPEQARLISDNLE